MPRTLGAALLAAFLVAAFFAVTTTGGAQQQPPTAPVTPAAAPPAKPDCLVSYTQHQRAVKRAYRYSHVDGDFIAGRRPGLRQRRHLHDMRMCARSAHERHRMLRFLHKRQRIWRFHRYIDRITPYGKWAIPPSIIACESHGSWRAANPSGAAGPYQIMASWGRPFPVRSAWDMARHHVIAAAIWRGGRGRGNWVC